MSDRRGKGSRRKPPAITRADRNIAWIETFCWVPEGRHVGQKIRLREWQKDILRSIYDNPVGTRRAIISMARKNAKTALAAMLNLLHLCGPEARPNSELYSAAQSRDQAAKTFDLAAKMVRMSRDLDAVVAIRDATKILHCPELGTTYRALSAEASTAYGMSPIFVIHDELGQVRGPRSDLYEALETATGAQEAPLSIVISTQAPGDNDLLSTLIDDALAGHDPRTVVVLYAADTDDDPWDEATIRKANPAFGDFLNAEEVMGMAEDARRMPAREAAFRNLVLNQRVESADPYITPSVWNACGEPAATDWSGVRSFAGLDLSSSGGDLTAFVRVAWIDEILHVRSTFWLPGKMRVPERDPATGRTRYVEHDGVEFRSRTDRVAYDVWRDEGHVVTTPSATVDYAWVAPLVLEAIRTEQIERIAFDRWNINIFLAEMERAGATEEELARFVPFGQGFQSMSPALRLLDTVILNGRMRHGGHPVLTMCAANATVKTDPAGNRKLAKLSPKRRIDGLVALAMAVGTAGQPEEREAVPLDIEAMLA